MTTINLFANDQHLTTGSKPKIASGDMNSVLLHVEFDPIWDRFTKTAVFFTSNDETVYEMILTDDECTVPHEVLAEAGTLFIGLRGICAEDNAIKTSTLIKYKIDAGAPTGDGATVDPTPDVYQQIMERLNNLENGGSSGTGNYAEVFNGGEPEQASGDHSHAEGYRTKASGDRSHAEGDCTEAGWRSHAEGFLTYAGNTSHAGGRLSKATGKGSFAHGYEVIAQLTVNEESVYTTEQVALDSVTVTASHNVNGVLNIGDFIYLVGASGTMKATDCRKVVAISEDGKTITIEYPFGDFNYTTEIEAECLIRVASGCEASGVGAHAEGVGNKASGEGAHAEGRNTIATKTASHAEGMETKNYSTAGHTEGYATQAGVTPGAEEISGDSTCAHAEGNNTKAYAFASHAEGRGTVAASSTQHAQGRYNAIDTANKYAHIVGNGTSDTARSNAHTVDWDGNGWYAGKLTVGKDPVDNLDVVTLGFLKSYVEETILGGAW